MNRRSLSWLPSALLAALLALPAHWLLFTQFMVYDDEGYVLWSLKNYVETGGLYTRVYSQYGPFFYAAYDALHRLTGLVFTNESGRWLTLGFWGATAWLGGTLVWRLTGSTLARLAAVALTFAALSVMSSEPIHPGGPLVFLSFLGAWCGCEGVRRGHARWFAVSTAAIGAAMLLTKINVGVFFLIAAGSWLALHAAVAAPLTRAVGWFVVLGSVASPLLLMHARIADARYAQFALAFAASASALAVLLRRPRPPAVAPRDGGIFAATLLLAIGAVTAAVAIRGTTWSDLLRGVVIAPLNQPLAYSLPPRSEPAAVLVALAGLAAATVLAARRAALTPRLRLLIATGRLLALAVCAWLGLRANEHAIGSFLFRYGAALAWLFAWPLREPEAPAARARLWLAWAFVWQTLHAFPVAGSQVAWGSALGAPLLIIGAWEALAVWNEVHPRLVRWAGALPLCLALVPCVVLARTGWIYRQVSLPLALPGAETLLLPSNLTLGLQAMSRNAALHADTLFSHPGMFSFNLWTGRPTPTAANVTLWSTLLSDAQQEEIRARLAADPRAVVIAQEYVLNLLITQGFAPRGELNRYLVRDFAPAFRVETYVFWVHRGRRITPVGTAHLASLPDASGWEVELVTDVRGHPARWQLWRNGLPLLLASGEFDPAAAQLQALDPQGNALDAPAPLARATLDGRLRRLTFQIPRVRLPGPDDLELRVLDAEGRTVERVVFRR